MSSVESPNVELSSGGKCSEIVLSSFEGDKASAAIKETELERPWREDGFFIELIKLRLTTFKNNYIPHS